MVDEYQFEKDYWGDCCNTFDEDQKHYVYAHYMGIRKTHPTSYTFDARDRSVIDIGGGPSSMLLKTVNFPRAKVVDPIPYPHWTKLRYAAHGISVDVQGGEDMTEESYWDEAWIYNCLQHVHDVPKLLGNAKRCSGLIRIFEWVNIPPHEGHPIMLTKQYLDFHLGGEGRLIELAEQGCYGTAYFGVFPK